MSIRCARCGARIEADVASPGEGVTCDGCGHQFPTPAAPSAAPAQGVGTPALAPADRTPPPLLRATPDGAAGPAQAESTSARALSSVRTLTRACPACGKRFPVSEPACPSCGAKYTVAARAAARAADDPLRLERSMLNTGVVGGAALIILAAVWFFIGLQAGYVFFYPPILAAVGIGAIVKSVTATRPRSYGRRIRTRR